MIKTERIVQLLFYLLLIIIVLGLINYNSGPLIPHTLSTIVIYVVLAFMVGFIIYYYIPKKKKH
jgi:hypothetical protein